MGSLCVLGKRKYEILIIMKNCCLPRFLTSFRVLMLPRQNFSSEAEKRAHGVTHVPRLLCFFSLDSKVMFVTFNLLRIF